MVVLPLFLPQDRAQDLLSGASIHGPGVPGEHWSPFLSSLSLVGSARPAAPGN